MQRGLAAPDYFEYPRVVLTVVGEPRLQKTNAGMLLKDRLYIGYQEKTGVLEVISYNETAARFEFQIVHDYAQGKKPSVFYANRPVCLSCHQNHAPIFSTPLWSETNANPDIAERLVQTGKDYYGIETGRGIDIPNAIDLATDRANLFSVTQALWRKGCGVDKNDQRAINCRASALETMLQYRLNGRQQIKTRSSGYETDFLPAFQQGWKHYWPDGLSIPNPDLSNRIPLQAVNKTSESRKMKLDTNIVANLDPLRLRPALKIWSQSQAEHGLIRGLTQFVALPDIQRLDDFIFKHASKSDRITDRYSGNCKLTIKYSTENKQRISFQCLANDSSSIHPVTATGRVYLENGILSTGSIDRLGFTAQHTEISDLKIVSGQLKQSGNDQWLLLGVRRFGLHARLPDGNAIELIEIRFKNQTSSKSEIVVNTTIQATAKIKVKVLRDFELIHDAIAKMRKQSLSGESPLFTNRPFQRSNLIKALFSELNMPELDWCCTATTNMPAMMQGIDEHNSAVSDIAPNTDTMRFSPVEKKFFQYCAACHQSNDQFPPNFLGGSIEQVKASLAHCAQRIHVRLQMWKHPSDNHKTPMPPLRSLHQRGLNQATWANSEDLMLLQNYVRTLIESGHPQQSSLQTLLQNGYESLQSCLPDMNM